MEHPAPQHRMPAPMAHPTLQRRVAAILTVVADLTTAAANPMVPTTKSVRPKSDSACGKSEGASGSPLLDDFVLDDPYPFCMPGEST